MKFNITSMLLAGLMLSACSNDSNVVPTPENVAPTISAITDRSTPANESSDPIAFAVNDDRVSTLSFSLMSDNQQVIANGGLDLGGSGTNRTLTVTPNADTVGDAFITIIVTDPSGLSASSSFLMTVAAQQQSMQQYSRMEFGKPADGGPALINAIEFTQDADADDFADLLGT